MSDNNEKLTEADASALYSTLFHTTDKNDLAEKFKGTKYESYLSEGIMLRDLAHRVTREQFIALVTGNLEEAGRTKLKLSSKATQVLRAGILSVFKPANCNKCDTTMKAPTY